MSAQRRPRWNSIGQQSRVGHALCQLDVNHLTTLPVAWHADVYCYRTCRRLMLKWSVTTALQFFRPLWGLLFHTQMGQEITTSRRFGSSHTIVFVWQPRPSLKESSLFMKGSGDVSPVLRTMPWRPVNCLHFCTRWSWVVNSGTYGRVTAHFWARWWSKRKSRYAYCIEMLVEVML
jgi:hypothetical protein